MKTQDLDCQWINLWDIIEESKKNTDFNSKIQYNNLIKLLKDYPKERLIQYKYDWDDIVYRYKNRGYMCFENIRKKIHFKDEEQFYIDFSSWLVSQGRDLFYSYLEDGEDAILSYIKDNDIKSEDYTFECMEYIFEALGIYDDVNKIGKYAILSEVDGCCLNGYISLLKHFNVEKRIKISTNSETKEKCRYEKHFISFNSIDELVDFKERLKDIDIKITNTYQDAYWNELSEPTIVICDDVIM